MFGYSYLRKRINNLVFAGIFLGLTHFFSGCSLEILDYNERKPQNLEDLLITEDASFSEDTEFDSSVYNPVFDNGNYDTDAQKADPDLGTLYTDIREDVNSLPIAVLDCPQNKVQNDIGALCEGPRDNGIIFNGCDSYDPDSTRQLSHYEFSEQAIESPGNINYETINSQGFWLTVPNCNLSMMFGDPPGYFAFCLRVTNDINQTSNPTCLNVKIN